MGNNRLLISAGDGQVMNPHAEYVLQMKEQQPPKPWNLRLEHDVYAIGGLIEVGYAKDSDYLLVISWNGRGVFDCSPNVDDRKIALDSDMEGFYKDIWRDSKYLTAVGIGILDQEKINLAGLWGGCLPIQSGDGWHLTIAYPNWPSADVILCPPDCVLFGKGQDSCVKVSTCGTFIAAGFSPTGKSFIVAQSHTLEIFSRA
jgi:hypothetical protein